MKFIILNALIGCLMVIFGGSLVEHFFEQQSLEISTTQTKLERLQRIVMEGAGLELSLSKLGSQESAAAFIQHDDGAAEAELQSLIKQIAQRAGGDVRSLDNMFVTVDGAVRYASLKVDISGSGDRIMDFIKDIEESSRPVLLVRGVSLHSAASADTHEQTDDIMNAQLTITGIMRDAKIF